MITKSRARAETADSEATALEGIRAHLGQIGKGLRRGRAREPQDRPRLIDPTDEERDKK